MTQKHTSLLVLTLALAGQARHVVAVGTCAAFGGVTAASFNPTDACGLQYDGDAPGGLLGADFRSASALFIRFPSYVLSHALIHQSAGVFPQRQHPFS